MLGFAETQAMEHFGKANENNEEHPIMNIDAHMSMDTNLDGRTVISYEVNVHAFYNDLSKRLDKIQLKMQRVKDDSRERIDSQ